MDRPVFQMGSNTFFFAEPDSNVRDQPTPGLARGHAVENTQTQALQATKEYCPRSISMGSDVGVWSKGLQWAVRNCI